MEMSRHLLLILHIYYYQHFIFKTMSIKCDAKCEQEQIREAPKQQHRYMRSKGQVKCSLVILIHEYIYVRRHNNMHTKATINDSLKQHSQC